MANVKVEIKSVASGSMAKADILDTPGIINKWKSLTPGAWGVEQGDFTNLLGNGNAAGNGILVSWQLRNFDIDGVSVGDTGAGVSNDGQGSFPPGPVSWKVLSVF